MLNACDYHIIITCTREMMVRHSVMRAMICDHAMTTDAPLTIVVRLSPAALAVAACHHACLVPGIHATCSMQPVGPDGVEVCRTALQVFTYLQHPCCAVTAGEQVNGLHSLAPKLQHIRHVAHRLRQVCCGGAPQVALMAVWLVGPQVP